MTVSAQSSLSIFLGNGSTTVWTFPWSGVSASDINVYTVIGGLQTQLLTTQYSIALNAPAAGQLWGVGGTVTYPLTGPALANGTMLIVTRAVPYSQTTNITNQTAYPASVQTALDTLCFEIQQVVGRTGQIRGIWITNAQYNYGDIVQDGGNGTNTLNLYLSTGTNTSGVWAADLANGLWSLVFNVQGINESVGNFLPLGGGTITGSLTVNANETVGGTLGVTGATTLTGGLAASGTVTVPTQVSSDNSTKAASTAMVQAAIAANVASAVPFTPQGRLTLVSGTPVLIADEVAQTAIYYDPYVGSTIPVWNGSTFINTVFTELTLTLNTGNHLSGKVYDVFVFLNSGTPTIATSPAWTNTTTRNAAISLEQGIWTNNAIITLINNATSYANIPAHQATYVGSFYATANGQTGVALKPAAATNGTNNIIGIFNAYNRVKITALNRDSTISWVYGSATWRPADNAATNAISWLDGLQQVPVRGIYDCPVSFSNTGNVFQIGMGLNSSSATPNILARAEEIANVVQQMFVSENFYPQIGLNTLYAMEYSVTGNNTVFAAGTQQTLFLDSEY